jgi:hypothetical protein
MGKKAPKKYGKVRGFTQMAILSRILPFFAKTKKKS